jgi:hypothetical protein
MCNQKKDRLRRLRRIRRSMSERRGSNPRPRPWQGRALPTELLSHGAFSLLKDVPFIAGRAKISIFLILLFAKGFF